MYISVEDVAAGQEQRHSCCAGRHQPVDVEAESGEHKEIN